jgi:uncharacterized protein
MIIKRESGETILELLATYPVVTVVGPRQSGKTTLARALCPEMPYVNLEDLRDREFATNDPVKFLEQYPEGAVIDEIQRVPDLSSQIQVIVDEKKCKGMFLLTGSHQFEVLERVSQSLSGRSSVFRLLPLSLAELYSTGRTPTTDDVLFSGMYPQVQAEKLNPTFFYQDYVSTYVERDLRQLMEVRNLESFRRFLKLAAGRIGQILDLSDLGDAVGVSQPTAKSWMELLQASFLVFLLAPYHANLKKRLVKRPKLYFYDTGLASFLLDMSEVGHLASHPLRGQLFENLVIADALKKRLNQHLPNNCYFYRDRDKNEVDLLQASGDQIQAVEIKSGKTVSSDYFRGLKFLKKTSLNLIEPSLVVYDGDRTQKREIATVLPLREFASP